MLDNIDIPLGTAAALKQAYEELHDALRPGGMTPDPSVWEVMYRLRRLLAEACATAYAAQSGDQEVLMLSLTSVMARAEDVALAAKNMLAQLIDTNSEAAHLTAGHQHVPTAPAGG